MGGLFLLFQADLLLNVREQINFEMLLISKFTFSRKMRFAAESTPRCVARTFVRH